MRNFCIGLKPQSAFGTPLVGDTLFGQVCWAVCERWGEARLAQLLDGYTRGVPFLVLSDAFPRGYLPRPQVPGRFLLRRELGDDPSQRKLLKNRAWIDSSLLPNLPSTQWLDNARVLDWNETAERCHNSLDRSTGATGSGEFAPFSQLVRRYGPVGVDLHAVLDPTRLGPEELRQILTDIGSFGYGRNATTGEGRFEVETFEQSTALGPVATGGAGMPYLILANMAPQGLEWVAEKCWYAPETRFGRHGSQAALWGRPFKNPILMARTGGVFTPKVAPLHGFVGQGVGGRGELSRVIPETVHQGYAPVVPLRLEVAA